MARAARQEQIPGTQRPSDPDLERSAEDYRQAVLERLAAQEVERGKKADLVARLMKLRQAGTITITEGDDPVVVYRYADDDGKERVVRFGLDVEVKVGVPKKDE